MYGVFKIDMKRLIKKKDKKLWVARDVDGELNLFTEYPILNDEIWMSTGAIVAIPDECLPEVTWENSPVEVELKLKQ